MQDIYHLAAHVVIPLDLLLMRWQQRWFICLRGTPCYWRHMISIPSSVISDIALNSYISGSTSGLSYITYLSINSGMWRGACLS